MARISLEQAYENSLQAETDADAAQKALDTFSAQQTQLTKARDDAKAKADTSDQVLTVVAQAIPNNTVGVAKDGTVLIVIGGTLHKYPQTPADSVQGDDGTADAAPPADTGTASGTAPGTGPVDTNPPATTNPPVEATGTGPLPNDGTPSGTGIGPATDGSTSDATQNPTTAPVNVTDVPPGLVS